MSTATTWHGVDLNWAYAELLGGIQRRTSCIHRAYDILHDSLIRLALIDQRAPLADPQIYLRSIVRNALVDQFRDDARWLALPQDDESGWAAPLAGEADTAPSAERLADLRQRLQATQQILDCLPPRSRQVFWLFRIEGHTYREIAERLNLTLRTVERLIVRALLDINAVRDELAA